MGVVSRQLAVNITAANTWTQLLQGGAAYLVLSSGSNPRADIKLMRALNLSGGSCQVEFAFSPTSSIADDEYVLSRRSLLGYGVLDDESVHVLRSGQGIYARVINAAGSVNLTARASLLEVS